MLVLSVGQLMSVCHKPVLYQNCRMDRACFYHRGFPPQSTCPALSCMQIQLPLQIMVLLYVELCCNSGLRKILQQPVDCCSLSSTLQPYLPTFNSSLSMVIIVSAHVSVEHSLFHAHVPLSATEVLLSQDRMCGTVYRLL